MQQYLKQFATHSAYNAVKDLIDTPNVVLCTQEDEVHYNPYVDPYNGHAYVDLGLPSGTLWATMNVGANSVTDYGNHYRYGNGANAYDSINTLYNGTENPLDLSKDTARVVWGGDWRMPTKDEYSELLSNTTYQWVTDYLDSGVNGATFTAQNGNVLFIPAAGDYTNDQINGENTYALLWTSTPAYNSGAWYFYSKNSQKFTKEAMTRMAGYSIRPVVG